VTDDDHDELLTDDELAALADIDELLADPALWESPSAGVEDDVVALIGEARRTELAEPTPVAAAGASVVRLDESRRSRRRRAWSLAGAALVGAAAAALVTGVIVSKSNDNDTTTADSEIDTFLNLQTADIQRVARTYFTEKNRTVLYIVPKGGNTGGRR